MNTDKIIAESIAKGYAPKESSKIVALKKLDNKAKLPATIFTYTFGIVSALVFGTGMCLAMQVIGNGLAGMVLGMIVGIVGIAGCCVNYPIYRKMLEKGKAKYLHPYLSFIKENQRVFSAVLSQPTAFDSMTIFQKLFDNIFHPILDRFHYPKDQQNYVMMFYLNSITAIITEWLKDGCQKSIEEISAIIHICIYGRS